MIKNQNVNEIGCHLCQQKPRTPLRIQTAYEKSATSANHPEMQELEVLPNQMLIHARHQMTKMRKNEKWSTGDNKENHKTYYSHVFPDNWIEYRTNLLKRETEEPWSKILYMQ